MNECSLKFQQLSHYAQELESNIRSRIRKFTSSFSHDSILEYKATMLNNDMDISMIVFYMQ